MNRCLTPEQLEELLAGRLEPPEEARWEAHLGECSRCEEMFDRYTATPEADRWRLAALELPEPTEFERAFLQRLKSPAVLAEGVAGRAGTAVDYGDWFRTDSLNGALRSEPNQPVAKAPALKGRLPDIPGFEILGELGRGGMGVVYRARQIAQNRPVALKMILAGHQATAEELGRFHDEAEAISRLRHPHIVQIFEVGQFDHRLYFVLEFVEGGTLADRINGKPLPPRSSAQLVESLARAMHYAHLRGIVHRDLKPANVLLHGRKAFIDIPEDADRLLEEWDFRRYMPKITDFGLAKLLDRDSSNGRTASGDVVGTPSYMAPEQAQGKPATVGPRTDVYSLGAVLYEMLTGAPPFQGGTPMDTLLLVHTKDPIPPRRIVRTIPVNLETICLKCLRKDPIQRYISAEELAEDLRLFLEGLPIQTRGDHPLRRGLRQVRRRLGQWTIAALIFALSILAGGALIALATRDPEVRSVVREADAAVLKENARLRFRLAQADCERGDVYRGMAEMISLLEQSESDSNLRAFQDLLRWNLTLWSRQTAQLRLISSQTAKSVGFINRSNDLDVIAIGHDGKLFYLDPGMGRHAIDLEKAGACQFVSATADGHWLAGWTGSGVRLWNGTTGQLAASRDFDELINCHGIDLSPDGQFLAIRAVGRGATLQLIARGPDVGQLTIESIPGLAEISTTAWHPSGDRLLLGRSDGTLAIATVRPWKVQQTRKLPARITSIAWASSDIAVAGGSDGEIRFWNATGSATPEPASIRAHQPGDVCVAVSAGGTILSGGNDALAKLWNAATGELIAAILHPAAVEQVAFSQDGNLFVTRDRLGTVRVWNSPTEHDAQTIAFNTGISGPPAISANGDTVMAITPDRRIIAWRRIGADWSKSANMSLAGFPCTMAVPSPDGKTYLTVRGEDSKSIAEIWSFEQHVRVQTWLPKSPVTTAVFRGDGHQVLTGSADGTVQIWNLAAGHAERTFMASGPVRCAAFREDQQAIIVGADAKRPGGETQGWSLTGAGDSLGPPLNQADPVVAVSWESNGKTIRTIDSHHVVRRWDVSTGQPMEPPTPSPSDARLIACDSDGGRWLFLGLQDSLRLLDQSGKMIPLMPPPITGWKCASFSPDGQWILTGWADGVRLRDASTGLAVGPVLKLPSLGGAQFIRNRASIMAWSATEVKRWDLQTPTIERAVDWRQWLRRSSGIEWQLNDVPRFLGAGEWARDNTQ